MCEIREHSKVLEIFNKWIKESKQEIFDKLEGKELPSIVITLKPQKGTYGYCTMYKAFKNSKNETEYIEISYNMDYLNRGFEEIFETLTHEMIHAWHYANEIKDCSKSQYHNNKFKETCDKIGLAVQKVPRFGWNTIGKLVDGSMIKNFYNSFIERYTNELDVINELISKPISKAPKAKSKNLHVYECPICGAKARAKVNAFLICGNCIEDAYNDTYEVNPKDFQMKDTTEEDED